MLSMQLDNATDSEADDWDDITEHTEQTPSIFTTTSTKKSYPKPTYDGEIFHQPHSIQVKNQLEIVYQAKFQKELITKVKKEFEELHRLVKSSQRKRLHVVSGAEDYFEETLEEEEEEAAEDVEYLKQQLQLAKLKLHSTNSEIKMTKEKLNSIRSGTHGIRTAYNAWDGSSPLQDQHALAPHICFEVGYTTHTNASDGAHGNEMKTSTQKRKKRNDASMSHIISVARRQNLATYIATGGDGKTNDDEDDNVTNKKLKAARRQHVSEIKSQSEAKGGFVSPSMKKMFMLSMAYEAGGGQTETVTETNKIHVMSAFDGVNEDPKFKSMQQDRYRNMMNTLHAHRVPTYVLTKFKTVLDEHEIALAKAAHTHVNRDTLKRALVSYELIDHLAPLHKEFELKLKSLTGEHDLNPFIVQQVIEGDKQAMQSKLRPALDQVMRVLRAKRRFEVIQRERSRSNSNGHDELDGLQWDHDHRLQRIDRKSKARLANIFQQHRVRANIATLLQNATHKHHRVVEDLLLRQKEGKNAIHIQRSSDAVHDHEFQKKIRLASIDHVQELNSLQIEHNLSAALIGDISDSHDLHHIHIMHGDSDTEMEEDETFDQF